MLPSFALKVLSTASAARGNSLRVQPDSMLMVLEVRFVMSGLLAHHKALCLGSQLF